MENFELGQEMRNNILASGRKYIMTLSHEELVAKYPRYTAYMNNVTIATGYSPEDQMQYEYEIYDTMLALVEQVEAAYTPEELVNGLIDATIEALLIINIGYGYTDNISVEAAKEFHETLRETYYNVAVEFLKNGEVVVVRDEDTGMFNLESDVEMMPRLIAAGFKLVAVVSHEEFVVKFPRYISFAKGLVEDLGYPVMIEDEYQLYENVYDVLMKIENAETAEELVTSMNELMTESIRIVFALVDEDVDDETMKEYAEAYNEIFNVKTLSFAEKWLSETKSN